MARALDHETTDGLLEVEYLGRLATGDGCRMQHVAIADDGCHVGIAVPLLLEQALARQDGLDRHEVVLEVDDDGLAGVQGADFQVFGRIWPPGAADHAQVAQACNAVAYGVFHVGFVMVGENHCHGVFFVLCGIYQLLNNARGVFIKSDDNYMPVFNDARLAALQLRDFFLDAV